MYTKEDVIKIAKEYFLTIGYEVKNEDQLIIRKDSCEFPVIAIGSVNDASSTSMKGKGFNKNQIKILLGLSLFEIISMNTSCKLILPDSKLFRRQFKLIKDGLSQLPIEVFFLSEVGIITVVD